MSVLFMGLLTSEETLPLHGRLIAAPRDLDPVQGAYELFEGDEGAAVVFVMYHQGEPVDLTDYDVQLLAEAVDGSPFALEKAPDVEPAADASRGEARWVVPGAVTARAGSFRVQLVVSQGSEVSRASNVMRFRVRPRVREVG